MTEVLAGWEGDLPPDWHAVVGAIGSDFDRIDADLEFEAWEPIFPARRGRHFPGQPKGAHALAAFDGIAPSDVRCMILGQDPYPEPGFATGRAFEAGNLASWRELDKMFSKSIRAYMQLIAAARTGDESLSESFERWPDVRQMLCDADRDFEGPSTIGDRWVRQGVLLLNASLTLSRFKVDIDPHQSRGHLPFWRPLMLKVIASLRKRDQPIVFIGFGDAAAGILAEAGLTEGTSSNCALILRDHPAFAERVLGRTNPFLLCNSYLEAMGASPIAW
ncbi:uracil-DNA glycosylase [Rhizobium lusitanum]|uniref:Uracil-DNA glycosylase n=1 Tax=Rhizobium lusitanum TaxID=293958 RepID=A0A6L9UDC7_9HYPH|nr:uracil-DNA glycosylase [Rhizobium lusitanum]NEI72207.1 uracil-DNA glycosylase [Rhizobium lusitanum]